MKYLALSLTAVLIFMVGMLVGRSSFDKNDLKHYQAACVLHDCCRNMVDNIGLEAEEIYYEYIDNLDCDPNLVITAEDIDHYKWSY